MSNEGGMVPVILPAFSRKRLIRRGDHIVSADGSKKHRVLRAKKVPCGQCGGTGVREWEVTTTGPYETKVKHKLSDIVKSGYLLQKKGA